MINILKKKVYLNITVYLILCLSVSGYEDSFGKKKPVVAVLPFDTESISENEANTLSSRFITELYNINQYNLVERIKLESIIEEQKFQLSGCTTTECLVLVGRLANAQYVIAGHYGKFGSTGSVSIRMIDVETGAIVKTASVDYSANSKDMLIHGMKHLAYDIAGKSLPKSEALHRLSNSPTPNKSSKYLPSNNRSYESSSSKENAITYREGIIEIGYHSDSYFGLDSDSPPNANGIFISLNFFDKPTGYYYLGVDYSEIYYQYLDTFYEGDSDGMLYAIDWAIIPYFGYGGIIPISKHVTVLPFGDIGYGMSYGYWDSWDPSQGSIDEVKTEQFSFLIDGGVRIFIAPLNFTVGTSIALYDMYFRGNVFISYGIPFK